MSKDRETETSDMGPYLAQGNYRETDKQDNYLSFFAFSTDKETCKQHRYPYLANGKDRETTNKQNYFCLCFE